MNNLDINDLVQVRAFLSASANLLEDADRIRDLAGTPEQDEKLRTLISEMLSDMSEDARHAATFTLIAGDRERLGFVMAHAKETILDKVRDAGGLELFLSEENSKKRIEKSIAEKGFGPLTAEATERMLKAAALMFTDESEKK